jgi:hypothetical protein
MKTYIYYNKSDSSKEPQGKFEAIDLDDAVLIAAHIKQMSIDDFLNVFKIEEYERKRK